jgi:hypothetical protein
LPLAIFFPFYLNVSAISRNIFLFRVAKNVAATSPPPRRLFSRARFSSGECLFRGRGAFLDTPRIRNYIESEPDCSLSGCAPIALLPVKEPFSDSVSATRDSPNFPPIEVEKNYEKIIFAFCGESYHLCFRSFLPTCFKGAGQFRRAGSFDEKET